MQIGSLCISIQQRHVSMCTCIQMCKIWSMQLQHMCTCMDGVQYTCICIMVAFKGNSLSCTNHIYSLSRDLININLSQMLFGINMMLSPCITNMQMPKINQIEGSQCISSIAMTCLYVCVCICMRKSNFNMHRNGIQYSMDSFPHGMNKMLSVYHYKQLNHDTH